MNQKSHDLILINKWKNFKNISKVSRIHTYTFIVFKINYINTFNWKFSSKHDFIFKYMSFHIMSFMHLQINFEFVNLNILKQVYREAAIKENFEYKMIKLNKK